MSADPRVAKWRELLGQEVAKFVSDKDSIVSWVWQSEVTEKTGIPLPKYEPALLNEVVAPFKKHAGIVVTWLTSEYSDDEPYFMISRKELPPGIDLG